MLEGTLRSDLQHRRIEEEEEENTCMIFHVDGSFDNGPVEEAIGNQRIR